MKVDHDIEISTQEITELVEEELQENVDYYCNFHHGCNKEKLLKEAQDFVSRGKYREDAADICVPATANAMGINLYIYQDVRGVATLIDANCKTTSKKNVYLLFHRVPKTNSIEDHYDAVVVGTEDQMQSEGNGINMEQDSYEMKEEINNFDEEKVIKKERADEASTRYITAEGNDNKDIMKLEFYSPQKKKYPRAKFEPWRFTKVKPERVLRVPWDANGTRIYEMKATLYTWNKMQRDGRHHEMHSGSRKGDVEIRKSGRCLGSLICVNSECPKYTSENVRNTVDFRPYRDYHICNCCDYTAKRVVCGCYKMTTFNTKTLELTVYYAGEHTCSLKINREKKKEFAADNILTQSFRSSPRELKMDLIAYHLAQGNIEKVLEVANLMDDRKILERIKETDKIQGIRNMKENNIQSFRNLSELKVETDKIDTFLLKKLVCREINKEPSLVMKTSLMSLQIAEKMCRNTLAGQNSSLSQEYAYFDGCSSRTHNYVSLTLWVYHKGWKRLVRLAVMEAEREDTKNITEFFNLFNEAMREYLGDTNYIWCPAGFLTDSHSANKAAIEKVFGKEMRDRSAACQFHFRQCARRQLPNIDIHDRQTFRALTHQICYAKTAAEYDTVIKALQALCERNKLLHWINWWHNRRWFLFDNFRDFDIARMNLAEVGHASMGTARKVWLSTICFRDVCDQIFQDCEYKKFQDNAAKNTGRGRSQKDFDDKELKEEAAYMVSMIESFRTGRWREEALNRTDESRNFQSSVHAKHRAPKNYSRSNPTQSKNVAVKRDTRKRKAKSCTCCVGCEHYEKARGGKRDNLHGYRFHPDFVPDEVEEAKMETNPPHLIFLTRRVQMCTGCGAYFKEKERLIPNNLIFKYEMYRLRPVDDGQGRRQWIRNKKKTPAYFHARDLACLRLIADMEDIKVEDIYMANDTYFSLTDKHKQELKEKKFWNAIVNTRKDIQLQVKKI